MNKAWHAVNRMPSRATLAQRVAWHVEHARACGCRPMPRSVRLAIKGGGAPGPPAAAPGLQPWRKGR